MRWMKVTAVHRGRYDGAMWIDADKLVAMQRVRDHRGAYTALMVAVPDAASVDGNAPGGFAGFDVTETPEVIAAQLSDGTLGATTIETP